MAKDLSVILDDRLGELARLGEAREAPASTSKGSAAWRPAAGVRLVLGVDDLEKARAAV